MQKRAVILLDVLEEEKEKIVVPSVMVAELLVKVDLANQANYLAELQKRFFIPVFDLAASAQAAKLWLKHKELPKDEQTGRSTLKADVMIVATARSAGASKFYSNDKKCRKLASLAGMQALDLPVCHPNMFRDAEIKGDANQ